MISLIGALIGLLGSVLPEIARYFQDSKDKQHEIDMLKIQQEFLLQQKDEEHKEQAYRMEAVGMQADAQETAALYSTWKSSNPTIAALNESVRPVIAYAFFVLYAFIKIYTLFVLYKAGVFPESVATTGPLLPWQDLTDRLPGIKAIWTDEDQTIWAAIIMFYFGKRSFEKNAGK